MYYNATRFANRIAAGVESKSDQLIQARRLKADWQEFLDRSEFEFNQDALSKELVSIESVGLEEDGTAEARHGFQSCHDIVDWFSDGEDSRYEMN